jgi:hypothetical protein
LLNLPDCDIEHALNNWINSEG